MIYGTSTAALFFWWRQNTSDMTKAAEVLQIAQPALSQSIKRLEQELGVSLFEREKRNIRLNDAGALSGTEAPSHNGCPG